MSSLKSGNGINRESKGLKISKVKFVIFEGILKKLPSDFRKDIFPCCNVHHIVNNSEIIVPPDHTSFTSSCVTSLILSCNTDQSS